MGWHRCSVLYLLALRTSMLSSANRRIYIDLVFLLFTSRKYTVHSLNRHGDSVLPDFHAPRGTSGSILSPGSENVPNLWSREVKPFDRVLTLLLDRLYQ